MDWSCYREEFPITKRVVFLDNAAVSPISLRVKRQMDLWIGEALEEARPATPKWFEHVARTRVLASRILGCGAREVAFASSTSGALSLFAGSLDWRATDNVVTAANEFPSNVYPWLNLKHLGVQVRMVRPRPDGRVLIEDLMKAVDRRTRVLTISWVGFNTGYRMDLARLGEECGKRGVYLVVDAIQGLGAFALKAKEWGITAAAADAHKWLLGPEGTALLYVSDDVIDSLHAPVAGWKSVKEPKNFLNIDFVPAPDASRFEPGSYNTAGVYGLSGALELFREAGMDNVTAHITELTDYLVAALAKRGVRVRSPRGKDEWSGIVSFDAPGGDGAAMQNALEAKGIVCTGRLDFMRVSPHLYNNEADIDAVVEALYGS